MPEPLPRALPGLAGAEPEREPAVGAAEVIAAALTVVWVALVAAFFVYARPGLAAAGPGTTAFAALAAVLPVALVWVAAIVARNLRRMKREAARLRQTLDVMRQSQVAQVQAQASARPTAPPPAQAVFSTRRDAPPALPAAPARAAPEPAPEPAEQASLAFGPGSEAPVPEIPTGDLIRAMNFPDNPSDKEGFRALRAALSHPSHSRLIRASQDVLTLLSKDGIYMDDLVPDRARPEVWRRFAAGERGRGIAALGGIRDRTSLALTAQRMRGDAVFRDAAHHFLRQFDRAFAAFEKTASDPDIAAFAETRTARAFMLVGRVAGTFD